MTRLATQQVTLALAATLALAGCAGGGRGAVVKYPTLDGTKP